MVPGRSFQPLDAPTEIRFILINSLTRRAKHWQNGILEKGLKPARSNPAGFLLSKTRLAFRRNCEMTKVKRGTALSLPVARYVAGEGFRAPTLADVEALARDKTEAALNVLATVMIRQTANPFARVAAAKAILDRAWGKPIQPLATDRSPLELIHRIERVLVNPEHSEAIAYQGDETKSPAP